MNKNWAHFSQYLILKIYQDYVTHVLLSHGLIFGTNLRVHVFIGKLMNCRIQKSLSKFSHAKFQAHKPTNMAKNLTICPIFLPILSFSGHFLIFLSKFSSSFGFYYSFAFRWIQEQLKLIKKLIHGKLKCKWHNFNKFWFWAFD